jgi:hypothetical protein
MSAQISLIAEDVWPKPHGYSSHPSWLGVWPMKKLYEQIKDKQQGC